MPELTLLHTQGFPFSQIRVPPNMPRPILQEKLGINYRRIPVMSIGRDIYIDSRLMLHKLETFFPEGKLGSPDPFNSGFEDMLEEFIIDGGPFWRTSGCLPLNAPLVQNEVWMKDRFDGSGGQFTMEKLVENRSWCISQLTVYFGMLEKMLADGRPWLMGNSEPGLAEIHAGWVFDWAINMAGDMQSESDDSMADMRGALGPKVYPNVHAWIDRFRKITAETEKSKPSAGQLDEGAQAEADIVKRILDSALTESDATTVDERDVLNLRRGQRVSVAPVDFGFTHKDEGELVGLSKDEVVILSDVPGGRGQLRLHYPRINFKILPLA